MFGGRRGRLWRTRGGVVSMIVRERDMTDRASDMREIVRKSKSKGKSKSKSKRKSTKRV
jgi:hypothetical protein